MTNKKTISKILICLFLVLALVAGPLSTISLVSADEPVTAAISDFVTQHADGTDNDQEITDSLGFVTDFGDALGSETTGAWTTPAYTGMTITQANAGDFSQDSETTFTYDEQNVLLNTIGLDNTPENKYALLLLLNAEGVAGIQSPEITIPAHGIYVLTFNVKVAELGNSATNYGVNAKIIDSDGKSVAVNSIKTENSAYITYAFVIYGNEYTEKTIKLQLLFGNAVENTTGNATASKQLGYAAVDTIRLFGATYDQATALLLDSKVIKATLLSGNASYEKISNGYFNRTKNQIWNIAEASTINDLCPIDWTQTTSANNTNAHFGIIDTNEDIFNARKLALELDVQNPGNPTGMSNITNNNNVLMLNNSAATYQNIKSANIKLTKSSYFEISFSFNTPANATESNALNFYIVDSTGATIYSAEDLFSYVEYIGTNNEWATFHVFISTSTEDKTVNFVINFGNETRTAEGFAFVDDVRLITKTATNVFSNSENDTYVLKGEEGAEIEYLATGEASFTDVQTLDLTDASNRNFGLYKYSAPVVETDPTDEQPAIEEEPTSNTSIAWYIVPSVLFGLCLIFGLIIYYVRKIKIKMPRKPKKNAYDRKKTLNKQVEQRERDEKLFQKTDIEAQLSNVKEEIKNLEKSYEVNSKNKKNKMALKAYVAKRERLQIRQDKLLETLKKIDK